MGELIYQGDSLTILKTLDSESVDCCITSPPYWGLRDYGTAKWEGGSEKCDHKGNIMQTHAISGRKEENKPREIFRDTCGKCGAIRIDNQLGLEKTPEEYVAKMVEVFGEVKRVLKKEGTLWLNLGDSYSNSGKGGDSERMYAKRHTQFGKIYDIRRHGKPTRLKELPPKNLIGIPWRVAFALQSDGWYLRQDIIWAKPNPMPESVTDRCTKAHEYIFLLAKSQKYYFDNEAIKETSVYGQSDRERNGRTMNMTAKTDKRAGLGRIAYEGKRTEHKNLQRKGQTNHTMHELRIANPFGQESFVSIPELRNKRSVWTITTKPFKGAHFATFPEDLILPCVLAGCPKDGVVLDPFFGAGTTGVVVKKNNRNYIGIELNPKYIEMAQRRIDNTMGTFL